MKYYSLAVLTSSLLFSQVALADNFYCPPALQCTSTDAQSCLSQSYQNWKVDAIGGSGDPLTVKPGLYYFTGALESANGSQQRKASCSYKLASAAIYSTIDIKLKNQIAYANTSASVVWQKQTATENGKEIFYYYCTSTDPNLCPFTFVKPSGN